jgi:hypothetical protein
LVQALLPHLGGQGDASFGGAKLCFEECLLYLQLQHFIIVLEAAKLLSFCWRGREPGVAQEHSIALERKERHQWTCEATCIAIMPRGCARQNT